MGLNALAGTTYIMCTRTLSGASYQTLLAHTLIGVSTLECQSQPTGVCCLHSLCFTMHLEQFFHLGYGSVNVPEKVRISIHIYVYVVFSPGPFSTVPPPKYLQQHVFFDVVTDSAQTMTTCCCASTFSWGEPWYYG